MPGTRRNQYNVFLKNQYPPLNFLVCFYHAYAPRQRGFSRYNRRLHSLCHPSLYPVRPSSLSDKAAFSLSDICELYIHHNVEHCLCHFCAGFHQMEHTLACFCICAHRGRLHPLYVSSFLTFRKASVSLLVSNLSILIPAAFRTYRRVRHIQTQEDENAFNHEEIEIESYFPKSHWTTTFSLLTSMATMRSTPSDEPMRTNGEEAYDVSLPAQAGS